MYNLALLYLFGGIGAAIFGGYFLYKIYQNEKKEKLLSQPFKEEWREYLRRIELYRNLPNEDKERIEKSIVYFAFSKEFIGVGIDITEEMKIVTAFYACLLLLHSKLGGCYDQLKTIIIYPNAVAIENIQNNGGIFAKEQFLIDGQSAGDTVVLIWHDAKKEAYHPRHENVVIHEFAHEIDFMDGIADGVPPIAQTKYHEWAQTVFKEFDRLHDVFYKNRDLGKYKLLGEYASTNEAEFFAVLSERFFESPNSLKKHFPGLYKELKELYGIDPVRLVKR